MALVGRHNIALMKSATTGTGTLTLTSAVRGFLTFALAGVVNGEIVTYTIRDGANSEVGRGTYTASGTTLSRDTVLSSTNAGAKISCSGRETVAITIAAEDMTPSAAYYTVTPQTIADGVNDSILPLTEWQDQAGIASLSSNAIVVAKRGSYVEGLGVYFVSATAFNGRIKVAFNGLISQKGYTTAMGILEDQIYIGPYYDALVSDGSNLGTVTVSNNLGSSIDANVYDIHLVKVGNQ